MGHAPAGIPALLVRLTTKMAYDSNRQMLADSITLLRMLLASQVELVSTQVTLWPCASCQCAVLRLGATSLEMAGKRPHSDLDT